MSPEDRVLEATKEPFISDEVIKVLELLRSSSDPNDNEAYRVFVRPSQQAALTQYLQGNKLHKQQYAGKPGGNRKTRRARAATTRQLTR